MIGSIYLEAKPLNNLFSRSFITIMETQEK